MTTRMTRFILFASILLIGLVLSFGVVSAGENMTDTNLGVSETPIDELTDFENENTLSLSEPEYSEQLQAAEKPSDSNPALGQQQQQQQQQPCGCNSSIIVTKKWEGNYSGDISYVEIQLLRKEVQEKCPPKCKASPDDPIFNETVGTKLLLPDGNGNLVYYTIVQTAIISKENNWRHVFKNITFNSAYRTETANGDKYWVLEDTHEYIIREINIQKNVEFVSALFVKNFTCPLDGGLKVFWNLTNRIIPNETRNETNETVNNETNETVPEEVEKEPIYNDTTRGPEPSKKVEDKPPAESKKIEESSIDTTRATGNPLLLLVMVISMLIIPVLRRKD